MSEGLTFRRGRQRDSRIGPEQEHSKRHDRSSKLGHGPGGPVPVVFPQFVGHITSALQNLEF
jgi:hypothetical protein